MRDFAIMMAVCAALCGGCKGDKAAAAAESSVVETGAKPAPAKPAAAPGSGIAVKHVVPEFSGTYDNVFAQRVTSENHTVISFVRDCPALTCKAGIAIEQIAKVCPKAYVATITVPTLDVDSDPARFSLDLSFAGPAAKASTATLNEVRIELKTLDNNRAEGSLSQSTTESSVKGSFRAQLCPLT